MALIRPLAEADWPQVHDLVVEVARAGETYAMDVPASEAETREFWSGDLVVVAVDGDTVLGSAKAGPNRPAQGAHVGTASFMVSSAARGLGIGRALGEHVVDWLGANGFEAIQFNAVVASNQAAVALWGSLGFEVVGRVPTAFRLPDGTCTDLLVMYLDLSRSAGAVAPGPEVPVEGSDVRLAVLDAAVVTFTRWGWSGTTTARVADQAGVSVAEAARCFGSKADLLIMAMRRVGVRDQPDLPEAFAAQEIGRVDDVDERLVRVAHFMTDVVRHVAPLVPVLWVAIDEDPVAAALRQGAELRRLALSRTIVDLVRRGQDTSPDAVGAVQTLTTAENYLWLTALGWSDERYAAWLARALDHAVNG